MRRLDKTTKEPTHFIDIKSEPLRDTLRTVLQNVNGICLREDKPAVYQPLFHRAGSKFWSGCLLKPRLSGIYCTTTSLNSKLIEALRTMVFHTWIISTS